MSKDQALWEIQNIIDLQKQGNSPEILKAAQNFLTRFEKHPQAVNVAMIWVRAEQQNPTALYTLGKAFLFQGNFAEAIKGFKLAAQLKPDMAEAWAGIALCHYTTGDLLLAMQCAEKAVSINPRDATAQLCILDVLYGMGEFEKGLERALEMEDVLKNHPGVFMALARFNNELGNPERADAYYKKAIKFDPQNPMYLTGRLILADDRSDTEMIRRELPNVISLFEKSPEKKKLLPTVWQTLTALNTVYDKNAVPADPNGLILRNRNMDKDDQMTDKFRATDHSGPLHLFEAEDLRIFTTDTIYYDGKNSWMNHRFTGKALTFVHGAGFGKIYAIEDNPPITLEKTGIYLNSVENYYHWLIDHLPRLGIIEQHPELAKLPIYVCEDITQAQRDSLSEIGIGADRLILLPQRHVVHLKHGFIPHLPGREMREDGAPKSWLLPVANPYHHTWLRQKMIRTETKPTHRLFLGRAGAKFRRLVNEDAIFAIAEKYGFKKVENSKMSFREQVDLYANTEALLGPHGAAFTNQAFMAEGTTVFELFPKHRHPPFYQVMAESKKQRYLHLDGPIIKTFQDLTPDFGDFIIDEGQFAKMMAENF